MGHERSSNVFVTYVYLLGFVFFFNDPAAAEIYTLSLHDALPISTLYNAMLAHPAVRAGKVDFSSIKLCVSGSAPLLAETKRRFEQLTGGRIIEVYSLTEACMASVGTPVMGTYKEGAVGIPLPDVDVRIVDVDDPSQEVGPGEIGEIVIEAPQLMEGYWKDAEATKEMLRGGRLYTGDLGSLDGDGYL